MIRRNILGIKIGLVIILSACWMSQAKSQAGPYGVHDPVMIKQDSTFYLFSTGWGIRCFSSVDKIHWTSLVPVFKDPPSWTIQEVAGYKGDSWAPDIFYYKGKYWLLYAVSTFGKNNSCIGLMQNATLDPESKDFNWIDRGELIGSTSGKDDWNAIDPNFILDKMGQPWLCFGSFWSGIKLVKLKEDLSALAEPGKYYSLADRRGNALEDISRPGNGAIEAPFIYAHGDFYYLFVSFDFCCRGVNSNYKVMVGRSKNLKGPYLDRHNVPMMAGGGTPVIVGNTRYPGVGHCGVYNFDGTELIIFHGYDSLKKGQPRLLMEKLLWDKQGWPYVDGF